MLEKIDELFSGLPMTLLGGVFLLLSFFQSDIGFEFPIDPAWFTVMVCGLPIAIEAFTQLVSRQGISRISSALLITMAMTAAIAIGDLFAAGEVAFIMALGEMLEGMTTERAKKGLKKLLELAPARARRVTAEGKEETVPAEELRQGDMIRILPGETIPADGTVISGESSADQSVMTGESVPVDKAPGDSVFCGTLNCFGSVDVRVTKAGSESSLQKLIRMVQDAENRQAPVQRIADRAASWFVPAALILSVIAYLVTGHITAAVTILVVFCPCALVLATPTAVVAAIGQATRHGVVIKSGEALERMGKVDTVAFDKTGTLTYGRLAVSDVISLDPEISEETLLALAASAESRSEHPLGKAVTAAARERNIPLFPVQSFRMQAGKGISAEVNGRLLFCGSEKFLAEHGAAADRRVSETAAEFRSEGKALVIIAENAGCIGIIALSDVIRPETPSVIAKLASMGTETVLLTGDSRKTAEYFASQAGIRNVHAELLPEEKVKNIQQLQCEGHTVCMIGDGVNDAPALKTADVSVAMGAMGSDIAVNAADVALMSDDASQIPYLKRLSKATVNTIRLSITLAMTINFIAIILSFMEILTPTTGALVHNLGSCFVVMIAALLYDRKFD